MKILYSRTSIKYLHKLDKKIAARIVNAIDGLPSEGDIIKFKGERVENIYRLRVGKYRVIFVKEEDKIIIVKIDTRGDVYK